MYVPHSLCAALSYLETGHVCGSVKPLTQQQSAEECWRDRVSLTLRFTWRNCQLWRTLPACLASHPVPIDLYFFCTFHHGISSGLIWLIDFEVVQTQFFVMRCISCTNAVCIVSWSPNFVIKVNEWLFLPTGGWVGAKKTVCQWHQTGPHTETVSFGGLWKPVYPYFTYFFRSAEK